MKSLRIGMLVTTVGLLGASLVACGDDGGSGGSGGGSGGSGDGGNGTGGDPGAGGSTPLGGVNVVTCPAAPDADMTTTGLAFTTPNVTLAVGDILKFTPEAGGSHDMEANDGSFDTGAPGTEACLQFTIAGSYPFHCSVHASMTGTITVE